ncbi:UNVERIFIED_CONTAM: hypothetical protein ACS92_07095 [Bacillus cereus]
MGMHLLALLDESLVVLDLVTQVDEKLFVPVEPEVSSGDGIVDRIVELALIHVVEEKPQVIQIHLGALLVDLPLDLFDVRVVLGRSFVQSPQLVLLKLRVDFTFLIRPKGKVAGDLCRQLASFFCDFE